MVVRHGVPWAGCGARMLFGGGTVSGDAMLVASGWPPAPPIRWRGASDRRTPFCPARRTQLALHLLLAVARRLPRQAVAHAVHASGGLVPGLGMLVAHSWATVLTALWLARGEALLWALLRRLAVRLLAVSLPPVPGTPFSRRGRGRAAGAALGRAAARAQQAWTADGRRNQLTPFRRPPPTAMLCRGRRKACSCTLRPAFLLSPPPSWR